jgi:hypothetical protein
MPNDTRLHREGGANLLVAAQELGVKRYVMQSRGFYFDTPHGQLGLAANDRSWAEDRPPDFSESGRLLDGAGDRHGHRLTPN